MQEISSETEGCNHSFLLFPSAFPLTSGVSLKYSWKNAPPSACCPLQLPYKCPFLFLINQSSYPLSALLPVPASLTLYGISKGA
jgi:hypothetical protein